MRQARRHQRCLETAAGVLEGLCQHMTARYGQACVGVVVVGVDVRPPEIGLGEGLLTASPT